MTQSWIVATAWLVVFFGSLTLASVVQWRQRQGGSTDDRAYKTPQTYRKGIYVGPVLMVLVAVAGGLGWLVGAPWLGALSLLLASLLVVGILAVRDDGWSFLHGAVIGTLGTFFTLGFGLGVFSFILTVG